MKPEQDVQALSLSKRGRQFEQHTSVDIEEFDEPKSKGSSIRPLLRLVQRNILLVAGIATAISIATIYLTASPTRTYEGDFRLQIEPITSEAKYNDPSVISRAGENATPGGVDYATLLQVLQSPGLLSKIVKQIQTRYPDLSYELLVKNLTIDRIGSTTYEPTKLIEVSYKSTDPAQVQFVLEELAKGYLNYSLQDRRNHIGQGVQFIEEQLPSLQQQVDNLESKLQSMQQQYGLTNPASDGAELNKQADAVAAQRQGTQRDLQEAKTLYANLQKQLRLTPDQVIPASSLSQDPTYQNLLSQQKKIESQIALESARFNEDSPVIQTLREQEKNISRLLNGEGQQIAGSTIKDPQVQTFQSSLRQGLISQLVNTANQMQVLQVREHSLAQTEASLDREVRQFPAILRRYMDIQARLDIATKTLNQLLIQRETLRVDDAQKEIPWEVVSAPGINRDAYGTPIPVAKKNTKQLVFGVIAGLALGLGAALLKEKYQNIFYTSEDVEEGLELPLLGVIPFEESEKQLLKPSVYVGLREETEVEYAHTESSKFTEAFNSLYASIRFIASDPPVRSLVVGSAAPRDGKTTIALNLAQTAAAVGQRVLLVDANLRMPELHNKLGLPKEPGLSDLLAKNLNLNDVIHRSPLEENLFVLTSGKLRSDSIKRLACTQMQHLMDEFQVNFDLVIYDTPHLGPTDANFLAANTDGILMVVGIGKTPRSLVMQVMNRLNSLRLPVLGVVANYIKEGKVSSPSNHNYQYEREPGRFPALERNHNNSKRSVLAGVQETDDALK